MIILLSSRLPGNGKDTIGEYLVKNKGFKRLAFADALKEYCTLLGWNGEKDEKGRQLLIDVGLCARKYDANTWVKKVLYRIMEEKSTQNFVITDCRFLNEAKFLKERISDIYEVGIDSIKFGDKSRENDPSQIEFLDMEHDYVIHNNRTLEDLYKSVEVMLKNIDQRTI